MAQLSNLTRIFVVYTCGKETCDWWTKGSGALKGLRFAVVVVRQAGAEVIGLFNPKRRPYLAFLIVLLVVGVVVGTFPAAMLLVIPFGIFMGLSFRIPDISQHLRRRAAWRRLLQGEPAVVASPAGPWTLAAPDSYALLRGLGADGRRSRPGSPLHELDLRGPGVDGRRSLTLALMELLARGVYDLSWRAWQAEDGPFAPWIVATATPVEGLPDSLRAIVALQASSPGLANGRLSVWELVSEVKEQYGSLDGYVTGEILRPLVERGYYAIETSRLAGCWPRTRLVLTAQGAAARRELEARLARLLRELQAHEWWRTPSAAVDAGSSQRAAPGGVLEDPQRGLAVALVALAVGQRPPLGELSAIERPITADAMSEDDHDIEVDERLIEALARSRFWEAVSQVERLEAVVIGSDGGGGDGDGDDGGGDGGE
jgi:hypothetical protein